MIIAHIYPYYNTWLYYMMLAKDKGGGNKGLGTRYCTCMRKNYQEKW